MSASKVLSAVILAGAVAGTLYWASRPDPVPVTVHTVGSGTVESTVANTRAGTVEACRRAELSLAVGGQIDRLPVKEGDAVEAGQVLLELWNKDLKARLSLAEQELIATRARSEEACVLADVSARNARRLTRLLERGLSSEDEAEQAEGQAKAQRAACAAARSTVKVADARVNVARANLERTILTAPFPGTIAEINGELYEFVTPSPIGVATPPAVDLIDGCCLYVTAPMDEVDAPQIRAELEARISLDAFPDETFDGRVRRVAPYVMDREKQARTVDVEVDFLVPAALDQLMPGYSADVEILLDRKEQVLRVPTEAVLEGPRVIRFLPATGELEEVAITTGIHNWRWTQISSGLAAGDLVVTSVDREGVVDGANAEREAGSGD